MHVGLTLNHSGLDGQFEGRGHVEYGCLARDESAAPLGGQLMIHPRSRLSRASLHPGLNEQPRDRPDTFPQRLMLLNAAFELRCEVASLLNS